MTVALNHSFVAAVVEGDLARAIEAYRLVDHVRRRTRETPRVHSSLASLDTGQGPFVQWANKWRRDVQIGPIVELLLRTLSGPFVDVTPYAGPVEPPLEGLAEWLRDLVRLLLGDAISSSQECGLVSPAPTGGLNARQYRCQQATVSNWSEASAFDMSLALRAGPHAIDVLLAAEEQMDSQLVVLPAARRSAESWSLDCAPADLHRAILGFAHYVKALSEGLSREMAAARYHETTTIPMSQESAATARNPSRRRQRMFVAGDFGEQYFDMHAKPGNLTRVHIWIPTVSPSITPTIFVGHCGRHLD